MRITSIRDHFLKTISLAGQVVNPRPNLPVLGNFLLVAKKGQLEVTATSLETTISQKIPIKVEEEGEITIPARILIDFCQAAAGEKISLLTEKDNATIKIGVASASLSTINASEFPSVSEFEVASRLEIERNQWLAAISEVAFCASPEGGRPVLSGVLLRARNSNLNLVATDGYRLAKKEMKVKGSLEAIIPARALQEGSKALEQQADEAVEIETDRDNNQFRLQTKDLTITTRLLEGDYPNYEQIIPTSFIANIRVPTKELADAIKLTSLFARELGNVVKLEIGDRSLKVNASTAQVGEAETSVPATLEGEKVKIAFNSRFLLEALTAIKAKETDLSLSGPTSAALLRGGDDKAVVYLVMPVRTQS
jgi:DNA polymerase-3 subunit beta